MLSHTHVLEQSSPVYSIFPKQSLHAVILLCFPTLAFLTHLTAPTSPDLLMTSLQLTSNGPVCTMRHPKCPKT